jgi:hypothetical protein
MAIAGIAIAMFVIYKVVAWVLTNYTTLLR